MPCSLERAVQSFGGPPQTAGSLRASQALLLWHTLLLLGFLFPWPYKYFHFAEWHHCISWTCAVAVKGQIFFFFFQNVKIGWCLEAACWERLTTELLYHTHTEVCHTRFSSCSPSHLLHFLFLAFIMDEEHPVLANQEVDMIQWEQTIMCVSVCVSHIVQLTSQSLGQQMPVAWPSFTHPLACSRHMYTMEGNAHTTESMINKFPYEVSDKQLEDWMNQSVCVSVSERWRVAMRHWHIVCSSRPEEGVKHAALITIFINQPVSQRLTHSSLTTSLLSAARWWHKNTLQITL